MPKPKKKCCLEQPRCQRCPLRMLAEGTLPEGYTVKNRKLVKVAGATRRRRWPGRWGAGRRSGTR